MVIGYSSRDCAAAKTFAPIKGKGFVNYFTVVLLSEDEDKDAMELDQPESHTITIAQEVMLTVTRIAMGENNLFYEISTGDTCHGKIFPTRKDGVGLIWLSTDDIEPLFVKQIGRAIQDTWR